MQYPVLRQSVALETLDRARSTNTDPDDHWIEIRGTGADVREEVKSLQSKLSIVRSKFPETMSARDRKGGEFEAIACEIVHSTLPSEPAMLGDPEFWAWLAVCAFHSLVDWRHGGREGKAALHNFGIGNHEENLFYRMWARADVVVDESIPDKYLLARRGDQDFWRSHVLRQSYGRCRQLVRALVEYQFPSDNRDDATLSTLEIRALAKRLKALHPNIVLAYLSNDEARALVKTEAEKAKRDIRNAAVER